MTHPTLILNTLGALAYFREKDAGCPELEQWAYRCLKSWADGKKVGGRTLEAALDHLNRVLGEVMVWIQTHNPRRAFFLWSLAYGVFSWHFYDGGPKGEATDELTAKCELVCAAAGVLAGEGN